MSFVSRNHLRGGLILYILALLILLPAGWLERVPGYMDAEYYAVMGRELAEGKGWSQPFLWNYLDNPETLPQPAFTYWMPLISILSALGWTLTGSFRGVQVIFCLLAALVPVLTYAMAIRLHGDSRKAWLSGLFALFPVFYLPYLPTTDAFVVGMLLGGGAILLVTLEHWFAGLAFGILAGALHFTRADGILWLLGGLIWWNGRAWFTRSSFRQLGTQMLKRSALLLVGYALVMGGWYLRNVEVFGRIFPPGNGLTLWVTCYEDLYLYPASQLTFQRWLEAGWQAHLDGRWQAFLANLQTTVAVQGMIVLFPFILIGMGCLRKQSAVRFALGIWTAIFLVFTLVFPYAGINGSFFHAGAGIQTLLWALAPIGIEQVVRKVSEWRKWERGHHVLRFVYGLLLATSFLLSWGIYASTVIGTESGREIRWEQSYQQALHLETWLRQRLAQPEDVVMVNNPPGYTYATGRPAIVIPFGHEQDVLTAGRRYGARFLLLDENNSGYLSEWYLHPVTTRDLNYLGTVEGVRIYEFIP